MKSYTKKQIEILNFIQQFLKEKGYSPTFREIQSHFNYASVGTVFNHIHSLKKKEAFIEGQGKTRALHPHHSQSTHPSETTKIQLIGTLSAGKPIQLTEKVQDIEIATNIVINPENSYAIKINGYGYTEELIAHNDLLIVETGLTPKEGDTILIEVNNYETKIKRVTSFQGYICLDSLGEGHHPLILTEEHFNIQGILKVLLRSF